MASRRQNVVRVLTYLADDLERKGYGMAGVLRQLAREVATMTVEEPAEEGRCGCGSPIDRPRRGRPRKSCHRCAPPPKNREKATLEATDRLTGRRTA